MNVELREYIIRNYPAGPHVASSIWPCIFLLCVSCHLLDRDTIHCQRLINR